MKPGAAPVTLAGAGNWLLGHDRVGPRVMELVRHRYSDAVERVEIGTDPLSLLDHLHGQRLLVVVDACVGSGPPGTIRVVEPDLQQTLGRETSVHQIGPVETLVVARFLWPERLPAQVLLLLVETDGLGEDDEDLVCRRVVNVLDRLLDEHRSAVSTASPEPPRADLQPRGVLR